MEPRCSSPAHGLVGTSDNTATAPYPGHTVNVVPYAGFALLRMTVSGTSMTWRRPWGAGRLGGRLSRAFRPNQVGRPSAM